MYQDPKDIYNYAVTYFDGITQKRQWFNDADTAKRFGKAMEVMEYTSVKVQSLVDL